MITTSTALRSTPAAARLVWNWPTALALLIHAGTEAGVDNHELRAGVDDNGRAGVRDLVRRQMVCDERRIDVILRRVADVAVRQRIGISAVGDGGDFEVSDLVAIPAWVLLLGERRCRLRPRHRKARQRGNRGCPSD